VGLYYHKNPVFFIYGKQPILGSERFMAWGIIYIVCNPTLGTDLVKIGKTNRSIDERLRELNGATTNLGKFEIVATIPTSNIDAAEAKCHSALGSLREQNNREFFRGDLERILAICQAVCEQYPPTGYIKPDIAQAQIPSSPRSVTFTQKLSVAKAARDERQLAADMDLAVIAEQTEALVTQFRKELLRLQNDVNADQKLKLIVPTDEAELLRDYTGFTPIAENIAFARSQRSVVPIALCRVYCPTGDGDQILVNLKGSSGNSKVTAVADDGRFLDLLIFPVVVTNDLREQLLEQGVVVPISQRVVAAIQYNGFSYVEYGYGGYGKPEYGYTSLGWSDCGELFSDQFSCLDRFFEIAALNVVENRGPVRTVQINDSGEQKVTQNYEPIFRAE